MNLRSGSHRAQVFAQDGAELVVSATSLALRTHDGVPSSVSMIGRRRRPFAEPFSRSTWIPRSLPAEAESFYDHQLIGLTAQTPSAENLGTVSEVVHAPGQDLLVVLTGLGRK